MLNSIEIANIVGEAQLSPDGLAFLPLSRLEALRDMALLGTEEYNWEQKYASRDAHAIGLEVYIERLKSVLVPCMEYVEADAGKGWPCARDARRVLAQPPKDGTGRATDKEVKP